MGAVPGTDRPLGLGRQEDAGNEKEAGTSTGLLPRAATSDVNWWPCETLVI